MRPELVVLVVGAVVAMRPPELTVPDDAPTTVERFREPFVSVLSTTEVLPEVPRFPWEYCLPLPS